MTGLDLAEQVNMFLIKHNQTSQTGSQLYSETSPYEVSECSMEKANIMFVLHLSMGFDPGSMLLLPPRVHRKLRINQCDQKKSPNVYKSYPKMISL